MKYYIWSNGDPSVGINGCEATVTVPELENWFQDDKHFSDDVQNWLKKELLNTFSELFGEKTYIQEVEE